MWTQASPRWATSDSRAAVVDRPPRRQGPLKPPAQFSPQPEARGAGIDTPPGVTVQAHLVATAMLLCGPSLPLPPAPLPPCLLRPPSK